MAYGYSTDLSDYDIGERKGQKIPRGEMEGYLAQERGMADRTYEELAGGKLSVAQQQMQAGLAGTQQALASQAAAGGANPLAARSAAYAGGMAGADVARQTAALRAQEMQAARQMQMGALQRGTEGILQQQQMDLQAQQLEAQMLAEERLREEGKWGKTKDIVDMASFGFISDPRMKDVYASDPATKTISAYMPQGGGRYGAAMPMPVAPPPTMLVEVPNPAWYPGDVTGPEEIEVQSSRPAMPPTIMDYVNKGAYGPQAPVRQPGRAAGAGRAVAKKGEAPTKGAFDERAFRDWYNQQVNETAVPGFMLNPNPDDPRHFYDWRGAFESGAKPVYDAKDKQYHWPSEFKREGHPRLRLEGKDTRGSTKGAAYRPLPKGWEKLPLEEQEKLLAEFETSRPVYRPNETPPPKYGQQLVTVPKKSWYQVEQENAGDMNFANQVDFSRAQEAGLYAPAYSSRAAVPDPGSENWEQMARRIEAEQRRKYYEQGGPGI